MAYIRFVPGFSRHPKRLKSGPISSWLWVCSIDYCMQHLTDGFLIAEAVPTLCSNITGPALKRAVDNLLSVGSWERVQGGYIVHDFLRHNQSKSEVEEDREASRERYNKWAAQRRANAVANALATPQQPRSNAEKTPDQRPDKRVPNTTLSLSVIEVEATTSNDDSRHLGPTRIGQTLQASMDAIEARHPELAGKTPRQEALTSPTLPSPPSDD